MKPAVDCV